MSLKEKVCYCSSLTGVSNSISKIKDEEHFIRVYFGVELDEAIEELKKKFCNCIYNDKKTLISKCFYCKEIEKRFGK